MSKNFKAASKKREINKPVEYKPTPVVALIVLISVLSMPNLLFGSESFPLSLIWEKAFDTDLVYLSASKDFINEKGEKLWELNHEEILSDDYGNKILSRSKSNVYLFSSGK